jgi:tripartite ATP-independent transporter DctP family solute receptor
MQKRVLWAVLAGVILTLPFQIRAAEKISLKFGHVLAPTHPYNLGAQKFAEILKNNKDVNVDVEVFHSSQLGNERDLTEGLQLGTVDLALAPGTVSQFEPRMALFDLPYIFRDREHAYKVLDGPIGDELAKGLPARGLRLLAYWENGYRNVTNSRLPIEKPGDLKGLKIRVSENKVHVATFKAFGCNVTSMSFGEVFTALQQKTIDAQENPLAIIVSSKFYEAQPYVSLTEHLYTPAHLLISEARWRSFPENVRKAIQEAAIQARDYERQIVANGDQKYIADLKAANIRVNMVDKGPFVEVVKNTVWKEFEKELGELRRRVIDTK